MLDIAQKRAADEGYGESSLLKDRVKFYTVLGNHDVREGRQDQCQYSLFNKWPELLQDRKRKRPGQTSVIPDWRLGAPTGNNLYTRPELPPCDVLVAILEINDKRTGEEQVATHLTR